MKKRINIQEADFELYLDNALKSYGYLFPETDEQMTVFEENMENMDSDTGCGSNSLTYDQYTV